MKIGEKGIELKDKTPTPFQQQTTENFQSTGISSFKWEDIEIICKLGSGASASVKKIKNKKDGKLYAMKVIAMDKNEQKEKTITSELKALYEIKCPSIIQMYEAFFKDGCIDLIIEFMDCGSLEDISKVTGPIPEPILSQMSEWVNSFHFNF